MIAVHAPVGPDITKILRLTKNQEILILLQCNLIDRLHCRSSLVVVQQLIGLELPRKDLGVACSRSYDTWQQERASVDDEVKISMCGYCPNTILTDPH